MKNKRHCNLICIFLIYSLFLVSCNTLSTNTYKINNLLYDANLKAQNKEFVSAIQIYDQILEIDEFNTKALYNKSLILFEYNKNNEALTTINLLIQKQPNNIKAYNLKADILLYNNDIENLINTYNNLLEIYPNLYNIRATLLEILIENYDDESPIIISTINSNSKILLENNSNIELASKALSLINKDTLDYSLFFYLNDKKTWEEINNPSSDNQ